MKNHQNVSPQILRKVYREADFNASYLIFMMASGVLSALALLVNSIPMLIGAMVIAPGLPPLVQVGFSLVAGAYKRALQGFFNALIGMGVAVFFAMLTTWLLSEMGILSLDEGLTHRPLIEERVRVGWYSVAAAIVAGMAGTVATIKEKVDVLVGIVASVALIPAGAAAGISFIAGETLKGLGGLALFGVNICLIISMIIFTLLFMGSISRSS